MLRNYLKIAYRSLVRDRFFSLLNLFGLTSGITAFILIALFVRSELSFDKFHTNLDRIWAMETVYLTAEGTNGSDTYSYLAGIAFDEYVPDIEAIVQLGGGTNELFEIGENTFYEENWLHGDNSVFEVFDFPIIAGQPNLDVANTVVLTESMANKFFGGQDAIGQTIKYNKTTELLVTAIVADPPPNSYIQFKMILSDYEEVETIKKQLRPYGNDWGMTAHTYLLLAEGVEKDDVLEKMRAVAEEHFHSRLFRNSKDELVFNPRLRAFEDIHLQAGYNSGISPTGDMRYVYLFSLIALLILAIACINYVNLSTARSLKRSKETGLRKVIGATRGQLIGLYLTESLVLTTISVLMAFAIAERLLPLYNGLVGRELSLSYQGSDFAITMIVINLLVGLTAGAYPAFKLSAFKPSDAIKGGSTPKGKKFVRRGLVLFQFMIAQLLIVATIVIQSQLSYLQNKDLGYNKEHALYFNTHEELKDKSEVFEQSISRIPGVESMTYSDGIFTWAAITFFNLNSIEGNEEADPNEQIIADLFSAGKDFTKVMGIELVMGRGFSDSIATDASEGLLINETAVKRFGWENPLGKRIKTWGANRTVIGVMKDFHNESLRAEVKPTFVIMDNKSTDYVNIRISPNNMAETMDEIEATWNELVPDRPFDFIFYDDKFDQHYKSEQQLGNIFFIFSSLAIGISLLGLVGLTAFTTEQRLKEVGIRKVLGASLRGLILMLSNEFVWLCSIAFLITTPITYYLMQDWLEVFKYRIAIDVFIYAIALVASLGVGWLVVCFQSVKVARTNPAQVLRNS